MLKGILLLVLFCLLVTIIVELLFALAIGVRGKDLWIVVLGQIVTNPIVVLVSNLAVYSVGPTKISADLFLVFAGVMEIAAIFVEGAMYKYFFTGYGRINPYVLSLILNLLSMVIGVVSILAINPSHY